MPSRPASHEQRRPLRGVTGAWVKEQQAKVDGRVVEYQVILLVTFVLE